MIVHHRQAVPVISILPDYICNISMHHFLRSVKNMAEKIWNTSYFLKLFTLRLRKIDKKKLPGVLDISDSLINFLLCC